MLRTCLSLAAAAFLTAPFLTAQDWTLADRVDGENSGASLGFSVARMGDVDGMGVPDVAIGLYSSDLNGTNSGEVRVVAGEDPSTVLYSVGGAAAGDLLGFAVQGLGDLTGTGNEVLAMSTPSYSDGPAGLLAGRVYVIDAVTGATLAILDGQTSGDLFGASMTAADLDDDGTPELLIGAPGYGAQRGRVYVFYWDDGFDTVRTVTGAAVNESFGFSLANAGDLDMAAGEEALVGAPFADGGATASGAVDVIGGDPPALLNTYSTNLADAHLGVSVDGGRDANLDGTPDVIAGAPDHDGQSGAALIFDGDSGFFINFLVGNEPSAEFGSVVRFIDDTNGDDRPEVAVSSPTANAGDGKVQVFDLFPEDEGSPPTVTLTIDGTVGSALGASMALIGDLNDDGADDLAVGAPQYADPNDLGTRHGRVEMWLSAVFIPEPVEISLAGPLVSGQDTEVDVVNLRSGATAEFWVDTDDDPFDGSPEATLVDTQVAGPGGAATGTIPAAFIDMFPGGTTLYVGVHENPGPNERFSNIVSGDVISDSMALEILGNCQVGDQIGLDVENANPDQRCYFYASVQPPAPDPIYRIPQVPNARIQLRKTTFLGFEDTDGAGAAAVGPIGPIPNRVADRRVYFQALSYHDSNDNDLYRISNVVFCSVDP